MYSNRLLFMFVMKIHDSKIANENKINRSNEFSQWIQRTVELSQNVKLLINCSVVNIYRNHIIWWCSISLKIHCYFIITQTVKSYCSVFVIVTFELFWLNFKFPHCTSKLTWMPLKSYLHGTRATASLAFSK